MRTVGRTLIGLAVVALSFFSVFGVTVIAARMYPSIWLPFTLAAVVGGELQLVGVRARVKGFTWLGIASGLVLMWMYSEPGVSFHGHPELVYVAGLLIALCAVSVISLVTIWMSSRDERPLLGWAALLVLTSWLIAFFSSPSGGSSGMIATAKHLLHLSAAQAESVVLVVRKCIHFSFYGLLGLCAFQFALKGGTARRRAVIFGLLIALSFACFDEGRQTFFPDRTASAWDVLLDLAGAITLVGMATAKKDPKSVALEQN